MAEEFTYPDVKVQLIGADSNVYVVIGKVAEGIRRKHGFEKAKEFKREAMTKGSYDEVLQFCMTTVEVY